MSTIKCGNCKERHESVAEVRACYGGLDPVAKRTIAAADQAAKIPAGRYAVEENGVLKFWKVDCPTEGRWAGYTFLHIQASDDFHSVKDRVRREAVLDLIAQDPQAAMLLYGQALGQCGHCGRTLTNDESRAAGIGPICRAKMGW